MSVTPAAVRTARNRRWRRERPTVLTGSRSYQRLRRAASGPSVRVPSRLMRSAVAIVAGLLAGVLVALGVLAAFVFVGPDPVGLRPTASPSVAPSLVAVASASASVAPSGS